MRIIRSAYAAGMEQRRADKKKASNEAWKG